MTTWQSQLTSTIFIGTNIITVKYHTPSGQLQKELYTNLCRLTASCHMRQMYIIFHITMQNHLLVTDIHFTQKYL